jgi:hypothetical protein
MSNRKSRRHKSGLSVHLPRRHRRRHRRRSDAADVGCCCIVDELFDGPCFVATAAYDDRPAAEPVRTLRRYRDRRLARHRAGRAFTAVYYRYGRYGARFLRRYPRLKPLVRVALSPLVAYARTRIR